MKGAFGNRQQLWLWAALTLVLVLALVQMRARSGGAAAPRGNELPEAQAESRSAGRARGEKKISPEEVPIISARDLEPPKSKPKTSGRNIFDFRPPTLPPPPTSTPAPPPPPGPGDPQFVGPLPPPTPTPTPPPPEIPFKFLGSFGSKEQPVAVLASGSEVVNARQGDIVFGQFILRKIGYESVDVGFVGRDPRETKRLGLTP